VLFVAAILFLVTANALQTGGIRAPGVTMYCVIALLAGILLGEASGIATALVLRLRLASHWSWRSDMGSSPPGYRHYGPLALWLLNCLYMGVVIVAAQVGGDKGLPSL
jgi:hypothetical protein